MATTNLITLARAREALTSPPLARGGLRTAVAPAGCPGQEKPWEGTATRKPWQHQITALIPHLETPETLPVLLELLALQTVRPYVVLLDTGSSWRTCARLEKLRRPDVEIHYVRAHGYAHSSAPVTTALDVGFALCRTAHAFLTHTDVFPRRRDLLEFLLGLCDQDQPVVGYEISPRPGTAGWRNVVSHTCTLLHMPTVRRLGVSWSFERYWEGGAPAQQDGFPDTEQPFDRCLRRAGVFPYLIGHDTNCARCTDANIDHVRSLSGLRLYHQGKALHQDCEENLRQALAEARARVRVWRAGPSTPTRSVSEESRHDTALKDLITSARAAQNISSYPGSGDPTGLLQVLVTACSDAIEKYCRRRFVSTAFDELYNGTGDRRLLLREYPIQKVDSVRYLLVTVLKVINNSTSQATQQARVQVNAVGLTLVEVASGVKTTTTAGLTWAACPTLQALATAITAVGRGWSAQVVGDPTGDYGAWPSADLYVPGSYGDPLEGSGVLQSQGALTALRQNAELKMHTYELAGYQWDPRGWLLRAIPYTDPELLHPEDLIWPVGINNFRVQYTAGYSTIPEAVQEACAQWVAQRYFLTQRDPGLFLQTISGGLGQRWVEEKAEQEPPGPIRALLAPYRRYTVGTNQG